jgi:hypothetical protein
MGSLGQVSERRNRLIISMAHAEVPEGDHAHVLGEWSDLVVGERPDGLVAAYLLRDGGYLRVAAVWRSVEHHDRALYEERCHPAYQVFEAAGVDPHHVVMNVMGSIHD